MPVSVRHLEGSNSKIIRNLYAKWTDGLHYKAEVLERDAEARRYLIKFEDNFQQWMSADELHAELDDNLITPENIYCSVCDGETSEAPNEIIICDICQQGYHVRCHIPTVDRKKYKLDDDLVEWNCSTCKEFNMKTTSQSSSKTQSSQQSSASKRRRVSRKSTSQTPKVKLDKNKVSSSLKKSGKQNKVSSDLNPKPDQNDIESNIKLEPNLGSDLTTQNWNNIKMDLAMDNYSAKSITECNSGTGKFRSNIYPNQNETGSRRRRGKEAVRSKIVIPLSDSEYGEIEKLDQFNPLLTAAQRLVEAENIPTEELIEFVTK